MAPHITRRRFLETSRNACGALVLLGRPDYSPKEQVASHTVPDEKIPPEFPGQNRDAVRAVVGASHGQIDRVKELVTARPALAKASWDWGFGDWESALGAASHTGRRDIAEFLMAKGARPNIFTYTMIGSLQVVESMVKATPGIQRTPGPHGITLLQHARNRLSRKDLPDSDYERMRKMVRYLESLGDANKFTDSEAMTANQKNIYLGTYNFGNGPEDLITVDLHRRGWLVLKRGTQDGRRLHPVEAHAFAPSGAPSVRIRFEVSGNQARAVTVHDPMPIVRATRSD